MKFKSFLEAQSLHKKSLDNIKKDAIRWRKLLDKDKKDEEKKKARLEKSQQKAVASADKKNITFDLQHHKSLIKDKESFRDLIEKFKEMEVDEDIINLMKMVTDNIDKNASKDKLGTRIISRNINAVNKLINHSFLKNNQDPKIRYLVSKIVRISDPRLNPKSKNYSKIQEFYKSINNSLFNAVKDLVFELIKQNVLKKKGLI